VRAHSGAVPRPGGRNKGLSTRDASNCHREVDRSPQRGSSLGGPVVTCRALDASGVMSAAAHTAKAHMVDHHILYCC
jgi:hypothetical protein